MVIICKDSISMRRQHFSHFLQLTNPRSFCSGNPVIQDLACLILVGLYPYLSQVFFHIICSRQRFIQLQSFLQTLSFTFVWVKVFRIFKQNPSRTFQNIFFTCFAQFMMQSTPDFRKLFIHQLHYMKMVKNNRCIREILSNCTNVSRTHIYSYAFNFSSGMPQSFPKRFQGISFFAISYINHCSADKIHDHGHIFMIFAYTNFIDCYIFQRFEPRFAKLFAQVSLFDVLNSVPSNFQKLSNILQGHRLAEHQGQTLKSLGMPPAIVCDLNVYSAYKSAFFAFHPRNGNNYPDRLIANRDCLQPPFVLSSFYDLFRITVGAFNNFWLGLSIKNDVSSPKILTNITVATHTKGMIEKTCGHARFSRCLFLFLSRVSHVHFILSKVRFSRKSLFFRKKPQ